MKRKFNFFGFYASVSWVLAFLSIPVFDVSKVWGAIMITPLILLIIFFGVGMLYEIWFPSDSDNGF